MKRKSNSLNNVVTVFFRRMKQNSDVAKTTQDDSNGKEKKLDAKDVEARDASAASEAGRQDTPPKTVHKSD